jgi:hypothetical protein
MASEKTVVKGIRASQEFFDKCDLVAKAEGVDRNKLIVRVISEYCEKVENTMIKQMEKCLNGEMLMSGIVRPIRAKENEIKADLVEKVENE